MKDSFCCDYMTEAGFSGCCVSSAFIFHRTLSVTMVTSNCLQYRLFNPGLLTSSSSKECLSNFGRLSFIKHNIVMRNDILSSLLCSIVYREVKVLHTSNIEKLQKSVVSKSHLELCHIHICVSKHVS